VPLSVLWIRIVSLRVRIQGLITEILKNLQQKKIKFSIKNCHGIYLSLRLHEGRPDYGYRRSLEPSKEIIQGLKKQRNFTFLYSSGSFFPSWIRIQPTKITADPCGFRFGFTTLPMSKLPLATVIVRYWTNYGIIQCFQRNFSAQLINIPLTIVWLFISAFVLGLNINHSGYTIRFFISYSTPS
jgi:hypothetical protein